MPLSCRPFLPKFTQRHPIVHPRGQDMGYLFLVQSSKLQFIFCHSGSLQWCVHYLFLFSTVHHWQVSAQECQPHFDGLVRERRNSIANALELRLSCTNPSICVHGSPAAARRKNPVHSGMLSVSSIRNPTSKASPSDASNEGHWPEAAETSNSSIEPYMGCLLQLVPEDEMAHHCMKLYWLKRWCHICVGMFAASNKGIRSLSQYKDSLSQVWGFPS